MKDLKTLAFWLLAPLAVVWFFVMLIAIAVSLGLFLCGFENTANVLCRSATEPICWWCDLSPWKKP